LSLPPFQKEKNKKKRKRFSLKTTLFFFPSLLNVLPKKKGREKQNLSAVKRERQDLCAKLELVY
jgi:hypothetical protein